MSCLNRKYKYEHSKFWNYPTRSRDGANSPDNNSDTGPDHVPDRDRGATPPRTTADSPYAVRAQSRSHVVPISWFRAHGCLCLEAAVSSYVKILDPLLDQEGCLE